MPTTQSPCALCCSPRLTTVLLFHEQA
jgi:hypothetical protein